MAVDVDSRTFNLDPRKVGEAISPRTAALIPVHLYGQPADMDPLLDLTRRYGLKIIEDAAQAHGARYKGRRVGSMGDAAAFSFYPAKNLGAFGDAGAITTSDAGLAKKARLLRNYGSQSKNHHECLGANSRLDELQAAFLRVKLRHLDERNKRALDWRLSIAGLWALLMKSFPQWSRHGPSRSGTYSSSGIHAATSFRNSSSGGYRLDDSLPGAATPVRSLPRRRMRGYERQSPNA